MAPRDPKGPSFLRQVPDGDNRERLVCESCGWIHYENPTVVVGAVAVRGEQVLLCRRAIEPRRGYWTIPAGFMEQGESPEAGARREAQEEACADLAIDRLLAVYSLPRISQVQLIYRANLIGDAYGVGEESLEVELVDWDDVPWDDIAFPTVTWALRHWLEVRGRDDFPAFGNPPGASSRMPR